MQIFFHLELIVFTSVLSTNYKPHQLHNCTQMPPNKALSSLFQEKTLIFVG